MKRKRYICKNDRCVWTLPTGTDIVLCPFIGCIYETDKPMFMVVYEDDTKNDIAYVRERKEI